MKSGLGVIILALVSFSCLDSGTGSWRTADLGFYLLQDTTISAYGAKSLLASVALARQPLFTVRDIIVYHWSSHTFEGTAALDSLIRSLRGARGKTDGIPFIVVAGFRRIYAGAFWYPYSGERPPVPYIIPFLEEPYRMFRSPADRIDVRNDTLVRTSLPEAGVLAP